jgi:hypothetical protein
MSTNWFKVRTGLEAEPEVVAVAGALGVEEDLVVGKLCRVWGWCDGHIGDMIAGRTGMTAPWWDRFVGLPGFMGAMLHQVPHWVVEEDGKIVFRNLHKHNGMGAKTRAMEAKRKRDVRNAQRGERQTSAGARWIVEARRDARYAGVDVEAEYEKARRYYGERDRRLDKRGFVKWLERVVGSRTARRAARVVPLRSEEA